MILIQLIGLLVQCQSEQSATTIDNIAFSNAMESYSSLDKLDGVLYYMYFMMVLL